MEQFWRDLRYGARMLLRTPAVTAVALLALALGIGANTAIFSVVYAVLLRPLPVWRADRLAVISRHHPRLTIPPINPGFLYASEWRRLARSFESMGFASSGTAVLSSRELTERVRFWRISSSFLPTLGIRPALGRGFTDAEDRPGSGRVAMVSYEFWQRRLGAMPDAVGGTIQVDGNSYALVGVMPQGFHLDGQPADVYAPIAVDPADRKVRLTVLAIGRLRQGVSMAQAQAEMDTIAARQDPRNFGWKIKAWGLRESMVSEVRLSLMVLLAAVGLVLLIACANVSSVLLARASARQREIAIRAALGAGRKRLIRQLLTESVLLAVLGGAAGLVLAAWCVRLAPLVQNPRLPTLLAQTRIDAGVLVFTMAVSLLTGLVFGAVPALSVSQTNVQETLKEGGAAGAGLRRRRLWDLLVISETALALLLSIGATLLIRSFFFLRDVAPGFRIEGLLTAYLGPAKGKYPTPEQLIQFYGSVLENVRGIPGVESATLASTIPLGGENEAMSLPLEGHSYSRPEEQPILWHRRVDPDYFRTLQIPLRRGRLFTAQDRRGSPLVAVINETMARRFWPGQDPTGMHLGLGRERAEIVGVVADVRHQDATRQDLVEVFFPYSTNPPPGVILAVRADSRIYRDPMLLAPAVSQAVAAADKDQKLTRVRDMLGIASERLAPKRLTATLTLCFAGLALVLAAIGVYGVLAFSVSERTHEIGVRIALGASPQAVLRMLVGRAGLLALAGVVLGIAVALPLNRVMASLLFGVSASDPLTFAGSAGLLLITAALAALVPARRAARVDAVVALRHQ